MAARGGRRPCSPAACLPEAQSIRQLAVRLNRAVNFDGSLLSGAVRPISNLDGLGDQPGSSRVLVAGRSLLPRRGRRNRSAGAGQIDNPMRDFAAQIDNRMRDFAAEIDEKSRAELTSFQEAARVTQEVVQAFDLSARGVRKEAVAVAHRLAGLEEEAATAAQARAALEERAGDLTAKVHDTGVLLTALQQDVRSAVQTLNERIDSLASGAPLRAGDRV
jgi:hypothetical protein